MAHIAQSDLLDCCERPARKSLLARLRRWHALRRQRLALSRLSDHELDDIGVTRAEAQREASRPMWDAPGHWYR